MDKLVWSFEVPQTGELEIQVLSVLVQVMEKLNRRDCPMPSYEPEATRRRIARYFFSRYCR